MVHLHPIQGIPTMIRNHSSGKYIRLLSPIRSSRGLPGECRWSTVRFELRCSDVSMEKTKRTGKTVDEDGEKMLVLCSTRHGVCVAFALVLRKLQLQCRIAFLCCGVGKIYSLSEVSSSHTLEAMI